MIDPAILILPDIHGRDFYKEAVREAVSRNIEIVCLGDYLDPYDEPYPTLRKSGIWAPLSEFLKLKAQGLSVLTFPRYDNSRKRVPHQPCGSDQRMALRDRERKPR